MYFVKQASFKALESVKNNMPYSKLEPIRSSIKSNFPNPLQWHRQHHESSKTCYEKLEALKHDHYLTTLTEDPERIDFLKMVGSYAKKLKNTKNKIEALKKNVTDCQQELKESGLGSVRRILRNRIEALRIKIDTLRDKKRFLKGDIDILTRPENRSLFSMALIKEILAANKTKTLKRDQFFVRACSYLGCFVGTIPAALITVLSARGKVIPLTALAVCNFLGAGGGNALGLLLEKPVRAIQRKFF